MKLRRWDVVVGHNVGPEFAETGRRHFFSRRSADSYRLLVVRGIDSHPRLGKLRPLMVALVVPRDGAMPPRSGQIPAAQPDHDTLDGYILGASMAHVLGGPVVCVVGIDRGNAITAVLGAAACVVGLAINILQRRRMRRDELHGEFVHRDGSRDSAYVIPEEERRVRRRLTDEEVFEAIPPEGLTAFELAKMLRLGAWRAAGIYLPLRRLEADSRITRRVDPDGRFRYRPL